MARILFTAEAMTDWNELVRIADGEISVFGFVEQDGQNFIITDIHLIKQVCTGTSTDMDQEYLAGFLTQMHMAGKDTGKMKAWIHSHVNMNTFWSGTDTSTISVLGQTADWLVSVVSNKKGEHLGRIDVFKPIPMHIDQVPIEVLYTISEERKKVLKETHDKLVSGRMQVTLYTPQGQPGNQAEMFQSMSHPDEYYQRLTGDATPTEVDNIEEYETLEQRCDDIDDMLQLLQRKFAMGAIARDAYVNEYNVLTKDKQEAETQMIMLEAQSNG